MIEIDAADVASMHPVLRALSELGYLLSAYGEPAAQAIEAAQSDLPGAKRERLDEEHARAAMRSGEVKVLVSTGAQGASLRMAALSEKVPYYTRVSNAQVLLLALQSIHQGHGAPQPIQRWHEAL